MSLYYINVTNRVKYMKVFAVTIFTSYDFDTYVKTKLFSTREKAKKFFDDTIEINRQEAEEYLGENMAESYSEGMYDVYADGRASEYEVWVRIEEMVVE